MKGALRDLVETPGIPGDEYRVRETIKKYVDQEADRLETDDFGNLLARKGSGDTTLMLAAHMDQIGFRVKHVDDAGYVTVSKTGGINAETMPGQTLWFYNAGTDMKGVVEAKPPHLTEDEETASKGVSEFYVDIAASDEQDAMENGIGIESEAVYEPSLTDLPNNYVAGPGLDNRIGCAVAIEALNQFDQKQYDADYELVAAFTREEEVGLKGAKTAANYVDPDVAVALDTAVAGDIPNINARTETHIATGKGPVITVQEANGRGLIADKDVLEWMDGTAGQTGRRQGQDYQKEVGEGGATDAASIYKALEGVPSGSIGVPTRHLHSPREVASMEDIYESVAFVDDLLYTFDDFFQ